MRRDKSVYVVMIIMGMVSVLSLTFACFVAALYMQEKQTVQTIQEIETIERTTEETGLSEQEVDELLVQRELDVKASMKQKMKELVEAKDGGPLTMLRYFFPEKFHLL